MSNDFDETPEWRRWIRRFILTLVLGIPLAFAGWVWIALHYSYSSGDRAGYVQKISHKGWLCKTWEGELAMVNLPGAMPQIFNFTVRDDSVAKKIQDAAGRRVNIKYEQHRGIPTACFGETEYFITQVALIDDGK
jgi:hypothetical protein